MPALAPPTVVQQIAGVEPRFDRLPAARGMRVVGELFRARPAGGVPGGAGDHRRRSTRRTSGGCCSPRRSTAAPTGSTRGSPRPPRAGWPTCARAGAVGCCIGAYGWLEHIALRAPAATAARSTAPVLHDPGDGGYVHAPGLTHAATAGVLRSGRLTHRRGDPDNEALDIDLSSARTRDALSLLDGMRRGQSLGALLGYRLERRLHERVRAAALELDRFIYVLRTLAPLRAGKLTEPGQPVRGGPRRLRRGRRPAADGRCRRPTITAKLDDRARRHPLHRGRGCRRARARPKPCWRRSPSCERTHDAVADLLLAESVHQLVSGNPARAAAALDVLGAGEAVPPEPEVVRHAADRRAPAAPARDRRPDPPPRPLAGWARAPRAQAEPRLEAWAQARARRRRHRCALADGDRRTLADAGLSALDVLSTTPTATTSPPARWPRGCAAGAARPR